MKKTLIFFATILMPALAAASLDGKGFDINAVLDGQPRGASSVSETTRLEWGCPVADRVEATNRAEAIQKVRTECIEEARSAAASKPEVLDVIQTKVIYPDVQVLELTEAGQFQLSGTFFVETLVVNRTAAETR